MLHLKKAPAKAWPGENKEDAFLRTGFQTGKKALVRFRDHQQSKCHLAALIFEVTVPQCLDVIAFANLLAESRDNIKRLFGKFTERLEFLKFSIYLVSLSLYTKLVYKVLFKRHLIFVANINPMFFYHYTALKLLYTLLYNSWQS